MTEQATKEIFQNTLQIREGNDFSFNVLQPMVRELELASFGEYIHEDELRLITQEGWGSVLLAFDGVGISDKPVGYQVVLFKPYNDAVESRLQPQLRERRRSDNRVMHDDVHFDPEKQIYFHLIGTRPEYQGMGVASRLKRETLQRLTLEQRQKQRKVCIRINNLPSIATNIKELGVVASSLKPIDHSIIGSRETNFNLLTIENVEPVLSLSKSSASKIQILTDPNDKIKSPSILIPVTNGGESDLEDGILRETIKAVFDQDYLIQGIFKASNLAMVGDSYYYATRIE